MRGVLDFLRSTYFQPKALVLAALLMLLGNFGVGLVSAGGTVQADPEPTFAVEMVSVAGKITKTLATTPEPKTTARIVTTQSVSNVSLRQPINNQVSSCAFCINIPGILSSNIQTVGMSGAPDYTIGVPSNSVGWWNGSSYPGSDGAVFLNGHSPGVLGNLVNISVGTTFTVTAGENTYTYRVTSKQIFNYDWQDPSSNSNVDVMYKSLDVVGGSKGLNLMTCTGSYISTAGTYSQRLVVYSVQV